MLLLEIDLKELLFGDQDASFLGIIALRSLIMFAVVLLALLALGKRGVKQLSIFELIIILTLGTAAGDPMVHEDVGVVTAIMVLLMVVILYRMVILTAENSHRFTMLIKGKPTYLIRDGKFCEDNFRHERIAFDEFVSELRMSSVSQLGQVKEAILETSGDITLFFYEDEEVKYGLPILPHQLDDRADRISEEDWYACVKCAQCSELKPGNHQCGTCGKHTWVRASKEKRVR